MTHGDGHMHAAHGRGGRNGRNAPREPFAGAGALVVDGPGGRRAVLREAEPGDEAALTALFEDCEDWFLAATGLPSAPGDVQGLFYALPRGADQDGKRVLVAESGGTVVGVVDVVLRHPASDAAAVGLFLLAPGCAAPGWVRRWPGCCWSAPPPRASAG
ncbi:hypothetical protein [Streptomyces sulfonofaciens]|nr:hypothetical protein [Streptomyces sulfonofaciens]